MQNAHIYQWLRKECYGYAPTRGLVCTVITMLTSPLHLLVHSLSYQYYISSWSSSVSSASTTMITYYVKHQCHHNAIIVNIAFLRWELGRDGCHLLCQRILIITLLCSLWHSSWSLIVIMLYVIVRWFPLVSKHQDGVPVYLWHVLPHNMTIFITINVIFVNAS